MISKRLGSCARPGAAVGKHPMLSFIRHLALIMGLILACGVTSNNTLADEMRHHEAHEHGVAHMNIAVEGDTLYIEFSSPAANIVGFEHHPTTNAQKATVKAAVEKLKAGDEIFTLPSKAQGKLSKSVVVTDIDKGSHADHSAEHGKQHNHGEGDERHSEFKAEYRFTCKKPQKLTQIEVMLFRIFPAIEHIEVQILTGTKQTGRELTAKDNKIIF